MSHSEVLDVDAMMGDVGQVAMVFGVRDDKVVMTGHGCDIDGNGCR